MGRRFPVELARRRVFTVDEAQEAFGVGRGSVRVILSRLEEGGWVERLERGRYVVIPLSARKGEYTLNEFAVGSWLVEPCAVSYWSALSHHGLTEQIPGTVFLQTTSRKGRRRLEVLGVRYRVVRVVEGKFFGLGREWIDGVQVSFTDREKTVVDCLDHPEYCGGVVEAAKALRDGSFDLDVLSRYAVRMGNSGVVRRLGYLCGVFGIRVGLPEMEFKNYLYLDPTMPKQGERNGRWGLVLNVGLGGLE